MYYRDSQDFQAIKQQYNLKRVQDEIIRTRTHVAEIIQNLDKYIEACNAQVDVIAETTIKKYVYLNRCREYSSNRITYGVGVMNFPDIENGFRYQWTEAETGKVFSGREKKLAREYAEQLAAEYRCEIRE
jgi:hypothetical protein